MKKLLFSVAFLLLSGCATTAISLDDAKKHKDLDVVQFVKLRFVDEEKSSLEGFSVGLNKVSSFLDNFKDPVSRAHANDKSAMEDLDKSSTGLMKDQRAVVYKAFYNQMNNKQLFRAKTELENFCLAREGTFKAEHQLRASFMDMVYVNPSRAFKQLADEHYGHLYALSPENKHAIKQSFDNLNPVMGLAEFQQPLYVLSDKELALGGYLEAVNMGAFGTYSCLGNAKTTGWKVTVLPFLYGGMSGRSNLLKILIVPEKF